MAARRTHRRWWLALLLFLLPMPSAFSADRDLERIRAEISQLRKNLERVKAEQSSAERDLQALDLQLAIHTRELHVASTTEASLAAERDALRVDLERLKTQSQRQKKFLAARLSALYRLGNLGYLRLLLSVEEGEDPLQAIGMLSYLVQRDSRAVTTYEENRVRIATRQGEVTLRQQKIEQLRRYAAEKNAAISRDRAQKVQLLARLRTVSTESERRLAGLEEKARRLERLFALLYEKRGSESAQAARIADFKGALPWPLRGPVIERFGRHRSEKFATYTVSNGIKIGAAPGSEVRSVFAGTVLFAQWFKGYGNLVIVDHGNRVFSLYGNTRGSTLKVGDLVRAGQPVAAASESEEGSGGYVYFEIREDNKPADPLTWLR